MKKHKRKLCATSGCHSKNLYLYLYLTLVVGLPMLAFINCHMSTTLNDNTDIEHHHQYRRHHHHHHRHYHRHYRSAHQQPHTYQHFDPSTEINKCHHRPHRHHNGHYYTPEVARSHRQRRAQQTGSEAASSRREALDMVVNRLHILESLDEQLRAFAEAAAKVQVQVDGSHQLVATQVDDDDNLNNKTTKRHHLQIHDQIYCQLSLPSRNQKLASGSGPEVAHRGVDLLGSSAGCLMEKRLLSQVPPYMLNLYRQLLYEMHDMHEHLNENDDDINKTIVMPYEAQVMRSFRQPKIISTKSTSSLGVGRGDYHLTQRVQDDGDVDREEPHATRANLVVELTLAADDNHNGPAQQDSEWAWPPLDSSQPVAQMVHSSPACPFEQRLLPAEQRDEICFWFDLSQNFRPLKSALNRALPVANQTFVEFTAPPAFSPNERLRNVLEKTKHHTSERLIEAELHVFKLYPRARRSENQTMSAYHLKTNLLEVSLYQILPKRKTTTNGGEFPLRLLDIRRIDLNSNGWETFYVKRAVADWLRDARVNLGLVIKAKSMFDEPLQVGQIKFADAYDHQQQQQQNHQQERTNLTQNFDTSHQPLLVIYTQRQ